MSIVRLAISAVSGADTVGATRGASLRTNTYPTLSAVGAHSGHAPATGPTIVLSVALGWYFAGRIFASAATGGASVALCTAAQTCFGVTADVLVPACAPAG